VQTLPKPNKGVINRDEFERLNPDDIEVFVVKPIKKITAYLSHVVIILKFSLILGVPFRNKNQ
jgi:hypothetical protein